jgi:hypothetical protein
MSFANRHSAGTIFLPTGNPDTTKISLTDFQSQGGHEGSLGQQFEAGNALRSYQRVYVDSGATAATPAGAVAANQAAYWKDRSTYTVTNDSRFAGGGALAGGGYINAVAGVFRNGTSAGYIVDVLKRGYEIPLKDGGNSFAAGQPVIAEADATAAAFDRVNVGTAAPSQQVGVARGAAANGVVSVDVNILEQQ